VRETTIMFLLLKYSGSVHSRWLLLLLQRLSHAHLWMCLTLFWTRPIQTTQPPFAWYATMVTQSTRWICSTTASTLFVRAAGTGPPSQLRANVSCNDFRLVVSLPFVLAWHQNILWWLRNSSLSAESPLSYHKLDKPSDTTSVACDSVSKSRVLHSRAQCASTSSRCHISS